MENAGTRIFEWDENKRHANVAKHGLDFADAKGVFDDPAAYSYRSHQSHAEARYVTVGMVKGLLIAVIFPVAVRQSASFQRALHDGTKERCMAETVRKKRREDEHIVTLVASLPDGTHIVQHPDGRLERRKSETDWDRLRNMTDEEIDASIANDPDWSDDWNWSDAVLVLPPKKKAISIRVDEDVLDFFKQEGSGYQRRINAVLRSYMQKRGRKKRA